MEEEPLLERVSPGHVQGPDTMSTTQMNNSQEEVDHIDMMARQQPKRDFTARLALAIAACTLGSSFQFGYNTGIVNAPEEVLKAFYNDTYYNRNGKSVSSNTLTVLWSFTVSIFAVGGMLGGVSAGYWANRFGRKRTYC